MTDDLITRARAQLISERRQGIHPFSVETLKIAEELLIAHEHSLAHIALMRADLDRRKSDTEELLATIQPMFDTLAVLAQCADNHARIPSPYSVNINVDRLREARDVYLNAQASLYGKELVQ